MFGLGILCIGTSCSDEPMPIPTQDWENIGPVSEVFYQISFQQGSLFTAAGRNGVFQQTPQFTGPIDNLGLALTDPRYIGSPFGARSVLSLNDVLISSIGNPADSIRSLVYRADRSLSQVTWLPSDSGILMEEGGVYSLFETSKGEIFAGAPGNLYISTDQGSTWESFRTWGPVESLVFHEGPGGLWAGGQYGGHRPSLWAISDTGVSQVQLEGKLVESGKVNVASVVTTDCRDHQMLLAAGRYVYKSNDLGQSFSVLLETSREVALLSNPSNCHEIIVVADSLYLTSDGGMIWNAVALPGEPIGHPAIEWQTRQLVIPILDETGGTVYGTTLPEGVAF